MYPFVLFDLHISFRVILCSQWIMRKQAHIFVVVSLFTYVTESCLLVMHCIVGPHHDNNNKMSHGISWCSKEVKSLVGIWADKHI